MNHSPDSMAPPAVTDEKADREFGQVVASVYQSKSNPVWITGYVDYEWAHSRHLFEQFLENVAGREVLEFGSNIGASSVVLAKLGAAITGVDVDERYVRIARLNAARYGHPELCFLHVPDTTRLPLESRKFDLVSCNSVLECVEPPLLAGVLKEIDRVLKPGGLVLITGTSNRLWPREVHSGRWLVNYAPRGLDRILGRSLQRGVFPWELLRGFDGYKEVCLGDRGGRFLEAKRRMGVSPPKLRAAQLAQTVLQPLGVTIGMLTHSITLILRKP